MCVPEINGFTLFTEADIPEALNDSRLDLLRNLFCSDDVRYQVYLEQKKSRGIIEMYAALQPFNESTRSVRPFLPDLWTIVKPGDIIVDLWARTGWHALVLAELFPEQQVIAIWDSNTSVLGYSGYAYWFSAGKVSKNLSVVFSPPENNVSFVDSSVAVFFAHDVMHRRPFPKFFEQIKAPLPARKRALSRLMYTYRATTRIHFSDVTVLCAMVANISRRLRCSFRHRKGRSTYIQRWICILWKRPRKSKPMLIRNTTTAVLR